MSKFVLLAAVVICSVLVVPSFVRAEEEMTTAVAKPISVGLLIGFGTDLGDEFNPWGLGFGIQGGYNLERLYLGARFAYHIGSSFESGDVGGTVEASVSLWEFSAELGYDFPFEEKLTFRPSLLVGIATVVTSSDAPLFGESVSGSDVNLLLSPGASLLYDINPDIFIGGDVRLPFVAGGGTMFGFVIYANGGLHF
ncbi:MAG TPA: outer membrane beta-barrel protein [Polyangiales bacterium]|nr:outer membrane beta-barrel protein [Polyangiales bacterium]